MPAAMQHWYSKEEKGEVERFVVMAFSSIEMG